MSDRPSEGAPPPDLSPPAGGGPTAVEPRWGLGDVGLGLLVSQALVLLASAVAFSVAGWSTSDDVPLWGRALLQVPLWAGWLIVVVHAGRTKGNGVVRDFGLTARGWDAPLGLVIGVVMQVVVLPLLYLPLLELLGSSTEELGEPARRLGDSATGPVGWLVLALIVVVGAPVMEELFYRGLFLRSLTKRGLPDAAAVVINGLVFAAVHFQLLQGFGLFLFGVVLSVLALRTGRLGMAIWAHVGFNATTVVTLLLTQ